MGISTVLLKYWGYCLEKNNGCEIMHPEFLEITGELNKLKKTQKHKFC